jgi:hypothetical protein
MYFCDDPSSSRKGAQRLTSDLAIELIRVPRYANLPVHILSTHISQPHPNPATCNLEAFTETIEAFEPDLLRKKRELYLLDSTNTTLIQQFRSEFDEKITNFSTNSKTDYSFVQRHLRSIAFTLRDTTVKAIRIAAISTDFIDHEPGKKARIVDMETVHMLNNAMEVNLEARLFVITDIDTTDTPLSELNATFLSSWTELKPILNNLFQKSNIYESI